MTQVASHPASVAAIALEAGGSRGSVLLVEDEERIRTLLALTLQRHGWQVTAAASAEEALQLDESVLSALRLLITDVVMPGMRGTELVACLRSRCAGLKVLLISGFTEQIVLDGVLEPGCTEFLEKPFLPSQLVARVRGLLDGAEAGLPRSNRAAELITATVL